MHYFLIEVSVHFGNDFFVPIIIKTGQKKSTPSVLKDKSMIHHEPFVIGGLGIWILAFLLRTISKNLYRIKNNEVRAVLL